MPKIVIRDVIADYQIGMNKEEILEYLKENLKIKVVVNESRDYYSRGVRVEVDLVLENEVISSSYDTYSFPERPY